MLIRLIALSLVLTLPITPAAAKTEGKSSEAKSPGEQRICEDIILTGSRLAKRRFCGTRAEWADRRLQDRQAIEKVQLSPCVRNKNGMNGRPSC